MDVNNIAPDLLIAAVDQCAQAVLPPRQAEGVGRVAVPQTGEIAELNEFGRDRVVAAEIGKRLVQGQ